MKFCSIQSIILLLTALCFGKFNFVSGAEWSGFLAKFTKSLFFADGFYKMPVTVSDALKSNPPFLETGFKDPDFDLKIFCLEDDPHVCLLFDKNNKVGGLRVSHFKAEVADDLSKFPYKYDSVPLFTSTTFMGRDLWYTNFLFTNPDNLKEGGPGRISTDETAEGLWVRLSDGWTEIPRDECKAQAKGWKKQGFIPWMGNHYTFGQTDDCSTFLPLLPIYHKGRLIGLSFSPLGKYSPVKRKWLENVPASAVKPIIPNGYQPCLQDWVKKYKASGLHFYFIKYPRLILWDQSPTC